MAQAQEKRILSQEKESIRTREEMVAVFDKNKQAGQQAFKDFWSAYSLNAFQNSDD